MNSNSQDNKRPPPRSNTLHLPAGRPAARPISQIFESGSGPVRHVSFDSSTFSRLDPTVKRFKLDNGAHQAPAKERAYIEIPDDDEPRQPLGDSKVEDVGAKLYAFPSRPGTGPKRSRSTYSSQVNEPVSAKPYVLDVPKIAPKYPDKKPADFYPWTGNQSEDTLNLQTITQGYFDKAPTSGNESASARPAIWANIKHKSGLQTLSSLFVTTLEQRQKFGAVSTTSTFKPPPRATLTETKREVWLKDLADSEIPLRRLSRTIPHGIRGAALLNHCVAKKIPIERALWFVKCVGANEIRAFKRKGPNALAIGTEAKWVREWTTNVHEFFEVLIDSCGSTGWKEDIGYGLRLVAHVYAGGLLDQEFFLKWIIDSVRSASAHKLPIWLLITQMYSKEMPKYRIFGKNLALALCEQAGKISTQYTEANDMLWKDIAAQIKNLALTSPSCFFWPSRWNSYADLLRNILQDHEQAFLDIRTRNVQAAISACLPCVKDERQSVLDILDCQDAIMDIKKTSRRCISASSDINLVATMLCQWATTIYRPGIANTGLYLALRLLRRWSKANLDLEPMLFSFIRSCHDRQDLHKEKLHRLVYELLRSKHIFVARYLQWIMAQGEPTTLERELLSNLPLDKLPDHARNLCRAILGSVPSQDSQVLDLRDELSQRLFHDATVDQEFDVSRISRLSLADKYDLAQWLRTKLFSYVDGEGQLSSLDKLTLVFRVLHHTQDYAVMADVLGIYMEVSDINLLDWILRIVNTHWRTLQAIGAAENLCEAALERMEEVQTRSPAQKPLLTSLADLVQSMPGRKKTLMVLHKELTSCEPKSVAAACSPVSDTMGEGPEDVTFFEQVELLFSTGTSMDRPLITRIFQDITKRLDASWTTDITASEGLVEFLVKLKSFNGEVFASLLSHWLDSVLVNYKGIQQLLGMLISGGLCSLSDLCTRMLELAKSKSVPTDILIGALELLLMIPTTSQISRAYRIDNQINSIVANNPALLAKLIKITLGKNGPVIRSVRGHEDLIIRLSLHDAALQVLLSAHEATILLASIYEQPLPDDVLMLPCYFNVGLCVAKLKSLKSHEEKGDRVQLTQDLFQQLRQRWDCPARSCRALLEHLPQPSLLELHQSLMSNFRTNAIDPTREDPQNILSILAIVVHLLDPSDVLTAFSTITDSLTLLHSNDLHLAGLEKVTSIGPLLILHLRMLGIYMDAMQQRQVPATLAIHLTFTLSCLYLDERFTNSTMLSGLLLDTITLFSDTLASEARQQICTALNSRSISSPELDFLFGPGSQCDPDPSLRQVSLPIIAEELNVKANARFPTKITNIEALQSKDTSIAPIPAPTMQATAAPFTIHKWEMVQDATPVIGDNDTSLSLSLFGARKAVM